MKVVLLNDTSDNRHFGCELVGAAYRTLLEERDIELIGVQYRKLVLDRTLCDRADLVIVNGEGSIHDGGYSNLLEIGDEYPAVLLNCSIQNQHLGNIRQFQIVTARESMSAEYIDSEIIPDLIYTHQFRATKGSGSFLSDSSTRLSNTRTLHVRAPEFVQALLGSKTACLGRFHAIAIAAMANIPFSAYPANTWKNQGVMFDMGASENYFGTVEEAQDKIPTETLESIQTYVEDAPKKISGLFDRIAEL